MKIKIYGLDDCVYCKLILHTLKKANLNWEIDPSNLDEFNKIYPGKEYPSVVIDDEFIGGAPALIKYLDEKGLI